jgi:hypothetical protein
MLLVLLLILLAPSPGATPVQGQTQTTTETKSTTTVGNTTTTVTTTQTTTPCAAGTPLTIGTAKAYKIKSVGTVTSSTARPSDYVEFTTMEDVYSEPEGPCPAQVMIPKGTSVFGIVVDRKHRHFPFTNGKLTVQLVPYNTWDNQNITLSISRKDPLRNDCEAGKRKAGASAPQGNCVAGRANANVAAVIPATAAGGTAVLGALSDTPTGRIIAATALFAIISQQNVGDLVNGTDAQIAKDEVFDMKIDGPVKIVPPPAGGGGKP